MLAKSYKKICKIVHPTTHLAKGKIKSFYTNTENCKRSRDNYEKKCW